MMGRKEMEEFDHKKRIYPKRKEKSYKIQKCRVIMKLKINERNNIKTDFKEVKQVLWVEVK